MIPTVRRPLSLHRIPILIVSGFLDDEESPAGLGLNIVARLPKPLALARLLDTVRDVVDPGPSGSIP